MIRFKNIFIWILKLLLGGVIALAVASLICLFYYNPGIHVENPTGATDYIWTNAGNFVSRMTEGMAWKKIDEDGHLSNTASPDDVDVLLMGSSHMEGANLPDSQTASVILNDSIKLSVYNISTSGHTLMVNTKNLEMALETYEPSKYVIIETSSTSFSDNEITEVLNHSMDNIPSYDSGLLYNLQKIPYLKLAYEQYENMEGEDEELEDTSDAASEEHTPALYDALAKYINEVCSSHGVNAIIFYHPSLTLEEDGSVSANVDEPSFELFYDACEGNGIVFLDMTQDFIDMYYESYYLPNGFCNSSVGSGHLNQYGHKAIAERLALVISALEGGWLNNEFCKH